MKSLSQIFWLYCEFRVNHIAVAFVKVVWTLEIVLTRIHSQAFNQKRILTMQTNILQQLQNSDNFAIILKVLKVMENSNCILLHKSLTYCTITSCQNVWMYFSFGERWWGVCRNVKYICLKCIMIIYLLV